MLVLGLSLLSPSSSPPDSCAPVAPLEEPSLQPTPPQPLSPGLPSSALHGLTSAHSSVTPSAFSVIIPPE